MTPRGVAGALGSLRRAGALTTGLQSVSWSSSRARSLLLDPGVVLNAFLFLAILTRLYGANITLTSDEAYWMQRTLRFGAALVRGELEMTYRTGHPGVTVMWTGLAGVGPEMVQHFLPQRYAGFTALEKDVAYLSAFASARYAMILVTSALMTAILALTWRLLGLQMGLLGGVLLLFDPYVVGMTRLLHVDALLGPLMAVSALAGLIWWRGGSRGYLALSSVAGGLALLTKAPALYLPIYFGAVGLIFAWRERAPRRWLASIVAWGVLCLAVYVLLWPVMWVDPIRAGQAVLAFVLREGGQPHNWSNYFLGSATTNDPGWLFYPIALPLRLGPLVLLGLIAAAVAATRRPRELAMMAALAGYALGFMVLMTIGGKKFDRYMLPAVIVLDLLAGVGLWLLISRLRSIPIRRTIVVSMLGLHALMLWSAYPYPLAYYNPALGGASMAQRAMIVGWGEGLEQVALYLNRQPNAERLVASTLYHHALRPLFRGRTVRIVEPVSPDYFIVYVNMAQRELIPPGIHQLMDGVEPEFIVNIHGVEYAQVYRLPSGIPLTPPEQAPPDEEGADA